MAWTQLDYKNTYVEEAVVPSIGTPPTPDVVVYSSWFDYGELGIPFNEFTMVYNYRRDAVGTSLQGVGVDIRIEWSLAEGPLYPSGTIVESAIEYSSDNRIMLGTTPAVFKSAIDIDLGSQTSIFLETNIAYLIDKFRFKFSYDNNAAYSDGDSVGVAIVLQKF